MRWQKQAASPSVRTSSKREASGKTRELKQTLGMYSFLLWIHVSHLLFKCLTVSLCLCSLVVNVMQRDSIPSEVDYETRQGVYSICLQLARCATESQTQHHTPFSICFSVGNSTNTLKTYSTQKAQTPVTPSHRWS